MRPASWLSMRQPHRTASRAFATGRAIIGDRLRAYATMFAFTFAYAICSREFMVAHVRVFGLFTSIRARASSRPSIALLARLLKERS